MMQQSTAYYERKIRIAVGWFVVGCVAFICIEVLVIYLGWLTLAHPEYDLSGGLLVLSAAGIWLLWEMAHAACFKTPLPADYKPIEPGQYPAVTSATSEIVDALHLTMPRRIYIAPGINAAVFCRPRLLSLFRHPKQELVVGELLLKLVTYSELKAILYHEFGHYASRSLDKKTSSYVLAQFSKSFIAVRKMEKPGTWRMALKSSVALFSYFLLFVCDHIDKYYRPIAMTEEFNADEIAVCRVGSKFFCRTLLKVAIIRHNHRYLSWCLSQLNKPIAPTQILLLLSLLCANNRLSASSIPAPIHKRIERIGIEQLTTNGQNLSSDLPYCVEPPDISSIRLVRMFLSIYPNYIEARRRQRSVRLTFHLDHRKHKLPLVDGKYRILLDGQPIGTGNFIKGFSFDIRTSPGKHTVEAFAVSGLITTPYTFECEENVSYVVEMDFKVHLRNGYYSVFASSVRRKEISKKAEPA